MTNPTPQPHVDDQDLLTASMNLSARESEAGGPEKMVRRLVANLNRQARLVHWLIIAVSMCFVLALSMGIIFSILIGNTTRIDQNSVNVHASCLAGNDFRIADRALWDQVLTLPLGQSGRPLPREQVLEIDAILDSTFALRIC